MRKKTKFSNIGVMSKQDLPEFKETVEVLVNALKKFEVNITLEDNCHQLLAKHAYPHAPAEELGNKIDLLIVVGGDGSFLNAARAVVEHEIPVLGINRGRLGFLTDINPNNIENALTPILHGEYEIETRFLLSAKVWRKDQLIDKNIALNDVVIYSGHIARMIEFEVAINQHFVYKQRSDGLIVTTPTGSTAYALSGGGPILHPHLDAIALVQMHPHTLSSRPIVINSNSHIDLHLTPENRLEPRVSFDGQIHYNLKPNDLIHIEQHEKLLRLVHPKDYDYFSVLRNKLSWATEN